MGAVEVAVRVAGDDGVAGRVDCDAVRPLEPGRPELAGPEPGARGRVLDEHEVLVARVRLAGDGAPGRERLVDVARRVGRDAAGTLLLGGADQRRLHRGHGRLVEELEDVLGALDERRPPDVPVVAAVDDAQLGGQVGDADRLVEEDVGLEVEIVDRVLRIRVLELVVADGDEHRQRQAGRRERREQGRVVELLVDRVDEEALAEPERAELARAGVARRDRDVDRGAEHDRRAEEIGVRERVAERAVARPSSNPRRRGRCGSPPSGRWRRRARSGPS